MRVRWWCKKTKGLGQFNQKRRMSAVMCLTNIRCFNVHGWPSLAILWCLTTCCFFFLSRYTLDRSVEIIGRPLHPFNARILHVRVNRVCLICAWMKYHWWLLLSRYVWLKSNVFAGVVSMGVSIHFAFNFLSCSNLFWCVLLLYWFCCSFSVLISSRIVACDNDAIAMSSFRSYVALSNSTSCNSERDAGSWFIFSVLDLYYVALFMFLISLVSIF